MIPMDITFMDIKETLHARTVKLPQVRSSVRDLMFLPFLSEMLMFE